MKDIKKEDNVLRVQAQYLGCYKEKGHKERIVPSIGNRDMNSYTFGSGKMTRALCSNFCVSKGFKYTATQYASHCFCDDTYGQYGKANNCNMSCS